MKQKPLFYGAGTKLRLPSGQLAILVRWKVKAINPENRDEGIERVASLKMVTGDSEQVDFSENFIRLCEVIA